jgi:hypothetical protein
MPRHAMTSSDRTKIIETLKKNPNAAAVAKQFGFGETTIHGLCKKEGIRLQHLLTKAEQIKVVEVLKTNLNAVATAKQLGVNHKTVLAVAKQGADRYQSDAAGHQGKKDAAVHAMGAGAWWQTGASVCRVSERRLQIFPVIEHGRYGGGGAATYAAPSLVRDCL